MGYQEDMALESEYDDEAEHFIDDNGNEIPEDIDLSEAVFNPDCKYPHIKVQLVGRDGNSFAIMAFIRQGLREAGISRQEQEAFLAEMMSTGSREELLITATRWVAVY